MEDETSRERAGPGPARKFPLRVSGRFSLLKAHRLEPVFSSWPGRDFISARLATASQEHNTLCKGMNAMWPSLGGSRVA